MLPTYHVENMNNNMTRELQHSRGLGQFRQKHTEHGIPQFLAASSNKQNPLNVPQLTLDHKKKTALTVRVALILQQWLVCQSLYLLLALASALTPLLAGRSRWVMAPFNPTQQQRRSANWSNYLQLHNLSVEQHISLNVQTSPTKTKCTHTHTVTVQGGDTPKD